MGVLMIKRPVILLIVIILVFSLSACKEIPLNRPAYEFLESIELKEYVRIYAMLTDSSKEETSLSYITDRFDDLYNDIGIKSIECEYVNMEYVSEKLTNIYYIMNIDSITFGNMSFGMNAMFYYEDNEWRLKWKDSLILPGLEKGDTVKIVSKLPIRGEIFDVNGAILAKNDTAQSVYVDFSKVLDPEVISRVLPGMIDETEIFVKNKLKPYYDYLSNLSKEDSNKPTFVRVIKAYPKNYLTNSQIDELETLPGIGVEQSLYTYLRVYPYNEFLAHTIGYIGKISEDQLKLAENDDLDSDDLIGKTGLEKKYELQLRGSKGYEISIYDPYGEKKDVIAQQAKIDGSDLWLSIDIEQQILSEFLMREYFTEDMAGAIIIMDPFTGRLSVCASNPTYNLNIFSFLISKEDWLDLNDAENKNPLYDRTSLGLYPPGSAFKPFTAAMALDSETISTAFVFNQTIEDNKWTPNIKDWIYPPIVRYSRTPSPLNMKNAITYSDNIFFAYSAIKIGADAFTEFCKQYGFTDTVPGDKIVATSRISNSEEFESIKMLADSGYGQGEMLISPLQMTALFASFANGGNIMVPSIVNEEKRTEGIKYNVTVTHKPQIWHSDIMKPSTIETLMPMLENVVIRGTASSVNIPQLNIAAKTGTAQIGHDNTREIAWFIGFNTTPYEDQSTKLVCVLIEVPADEGSIKNDIAKALFEYGLSD